ALLVDRGIAEGKPVEPVQDMDHALASRVDNACLAQDIEHLWRLRQRLARALERRFQHRKDVALARRRLRRLFGSDADHGQHRAFDRTHHGGVGLLASAIQCRREVLPADGGLALDGSREAPKDLGEDDAGVAPRAHERAEGEPVGDRTDAGRVIRLARGLERGVHRERHVRAGVAIRDREDIERVDAITVVVEPLRRERQRAQQVLALPFGGWRCRAEGRRTGHGAFSVLALTRRPSTLTFTRSTVMPSRCSTWNFTVCMTFWATVKIGVPDSTPTEGSLWRSPLSV